MREIEIDSKEQKNSNNEDVTKSVPLMPGASKWNGN